MSSILIIVVLFVGARLFFNGKNKFEKIAGVVLIIAGIIALAVIAFASPAQAAPANFLAADPRCKDPELRKQNQLIVNIIRGEEQPAYSYIDGNIIVFETWAEAGQVDYEEVYLALRNWGWKDLGGMPGQKTFKEPDGGFFPCPSQGLPILPFIIVIFLVVFGFLVLRRPLQFWFPKGEKI